MMPGRRNGRGAGRVSGWVARRFLFSPKSHSVINIISRVSMVAVGVPVAAMVILMAVFSGFDSLIRGMYRDFDPDVLIAPTGGKTFDPGMLDVAAIEALDGVSAVSAVLEESAMATYRGRQTSATVRGVDGGFAQVVPIGGMMFAGTAGNISENTPQAGVSQGPLPPERDSDSPLPDATRAVAVLGMGVAYNLGGVAVAVNDSLEFLVPRRGAWSALIPTAAFAGERAAIDGVFTLDADTDGKYVFVPLEFAQRLFGYPGQISGLMVRFDGGSSAGIAAARLQTQIAEIAGGGFTVLNRGQQRESMYRIMVLEKWGIFLIGLLVLVVASFSIVGSLIMLVIDKRGGIETLKALGATRGVIRGIFVRQGMMIGAIGAAGGLVLGVAVCAVQQIWGVIPMPGASFLVESYPVRMRLADIAAICAAFIAVNHIITIFTVRSTIKK